MLNNTNKSDSIYKTIIQKSFILLSLMFLWELIARSGIFNELLFPRFSTIALSFFQQVQNGYLIEITLVSLSLIFKGLLISLIIALLLSFLAMMGNFFHNLVEVLNSIFHPLPGIALLPVAMLWFGLSEASIIFIIAHSVIWPMVISFLTGLKSIPRINIEVGQNIGLKGPALIWGVMLPAASPYILSGIKIGWARAWRSAIAAEMVFGAVGTAGGLGWHIFKTRYDFDIVGTFAALLTIMVVGIVVEELFFNSIENRTIKRWNMIV